MTSSPPGAPNRQAAVAPDARTGAETLPPLHIGALRWPRVALRTALIGIWTLFIALPVLLTCTIAVLLPGPSDRWRAPLRRPIARIWGRGMAAILRIRIRYEGTPPPAGALVVSNHLSYLDIPVLNAIVPAVFVAKAEVRGWPVWGMLSAAGDTIFVDRGLRRDILRVRLAMTRALDRRDTVVLFPEATSTAGDTILPFRSPLLADAARSLHPVYWATLSYTTPPGEPSARDRVCWWGDRGFLPHLVGVMALRRIVCRVRFGDAPIVADNRKALAGALREAMMRGFRPVSRSGNP